MFLGVDTGGTFTDFVLVTLDQGRPVMRTHKVLSTPEAPEQAILQGIAELGLEAPMGEGLIRIVHGSTVATNAALENRGVSTAFITNRGFRDLLTIARQTRPDIYALQVPPQPGPVPEELCLECGGRLDANGEVLDALTQEDITSLVDRLRELSPRAIAINFLFSFLDDSHEAHLQQALKAALPDTFVCRSSQVLPEYREYERGIATWLNATLGPLVEGYLLRLKQGTAPSRLAVMQSSGGIMRADQAAERAVNLLLSGPAGGLAAARAIAVSTGLDRLMTFDMGGTSTDVALVDGEIRLTSEGRIGPWPIAVPMVDMHTIGAGGGSVAHVDEGRLLHVGPRSAGALPGPACYGRGGTEPTVTDANLVLGRLPENVAMGGSFRPDPEAARRAVGGLGADLGLELRETAAGIIRLANEHMARALRVISVEQGHDPADFHLCCFGGAGGLHLCALAEALGMSRALIPANSGVLSALGMVLAPVERQFSRTRTGLLRELGDDEVAAVAEALSAQALTELADEGFAEADITLETSVDLRYQGQSACLTLPWIDREGTTRSFHDTHRQRYGHALNAAVELVTVRLRASAPGCLADLPALSADPGDSLLTTCRVEGYADPVPVYRRGNLAAGSQVKGPAVVLEETATSFIDAGWSGEVDRFGHIRLTRRAVSEP